LTYDNTQINVLSIGFFEILKNFAEKLEMVCTSIHLVAIGDRLKHANSNVKNTFVFVMGQNKKILHTNKFMLSFETSDSYI